MAVGTPEVFVFPTLRKRDDTASWFSSFLLFVSSLMLMRPTTVVVELQLNVQSWVSRVRRRGPATNCKERD